MIELVKNIKLMCAWRFENGFRNDTLGNIRFGTLVYPEQDGLD